MAVTYKRMKDLSEITQDNLAFFGVTVSNIYAVKEGTVTLGFVGKRIEPRVVIGQTMRWRALFGGMWLDLPRRGDFVGAYERKASRR